MYMEQAKKEKMKAEAIKRMKTLGIIDNAIEDFKEDKVNISEPGIIPGALFFASESEEKIMREVEEKYNILIYTGIRSFTEFGELISFLYVSESEEEWDMDMADIELGYSTGYVYNKDDEYCSEFGGIEIRQINGGLVRIS